MTQSVHEDADGPFDDGSAGGAAVGPNLVTAALVRVEAGDGQAAAVADVHDALLRSGGLDVGDTAADGGARVARATFRSVADATRVAVELAERGPAAHAPVRAALSTGHPDGADRASPGRTPAARAEALLAHAGPGQVLTTATTAVMGGRSLPRGAELVDHGSATLDAGGTPERVYRLRVEAVPHADERIGASNLEWARRALEGPVVGHDGPLGALAKAWKPVLDGRSRTVLVTGAGAGAAATAVAAEAALRLHADGAYVLYGRWDSAAALPYKALREALGVHADGCSVEVLRADLDGWSDEVGRLLPDVGARAGGRPPRRADAHAARHGLFRAVEAWLGAIARRRPTLLVLDDLHRADPESFPLLDALGHTRSRGRLMTVVTAALDGGEAAARVEAFAGRADAASFDRITLD